MIANYEKKSFVARGFTIVELLIVIVIIAILATISIVAYNGIKGRAVLSSMQSDLESSTKLLANQLTLTGAYPLTDSILPKSNGSTYSYIPNNSSSPPSYTLTISNTLSTSSYNVTNLNNIPTLVSAVAPVITQPASNAAASYNTDGCGPGAQYYSMYLLSVGSGTPSPTIQWQKLPKNAVSGTWASIVSATTAVYSYDGSSDGLNNGDFINFRVIYTSGTLSTTSPMITVTLTNGC